ncbi:hypothetical protein [Caballeronia sp. TF1N1]|uniref:hypothetical protein n=1 Tax=Caballeronia sp. TF1N1 TaxID=2878153 RepID=UPI001FD25FE8|nr:hypothetical protein [Caballeronia sp. TF1N1]
MKGIFLRVFGIFALIVATTAASAKGPERISRGDCHATFIVPNGLEYVEVDGIQISSNDECHIAFRYTGDLKIKSRAIPPPTAEDWRWLTDFALSVKREPLEDRLAQIKSTDGLEKPGMFNLVSSEHFEIPGGEVFILRYSAIEPGKAMLRSNEPEETIFAAGNSSCSISYIQYTGLKMTKKDNEKSRSV